MARLERSYEYIDVSRYAPNTRRRRAPEKPEVVRETTFTTIRPSRVKSRTFLQKDELDEGELPYTQQDFVDTFKDTFRPVYEEKPEVHGKTSAERLSSRPARKPRPAVPPKKPGLTINRHPKIVNDTQPSAKPKPLTVPKILGSGPDLTAGRDRHNTLFLIKTGRRAGRQPVKFESLSSDTSSSTTTPSVRPAAVMQVRRKTKTRTRL